MTQHLINGIRPLGLPLITPEETTARADILTFRVPNGPALFETLQVNNIQTALREGCTRIAPHFCNTIEEIDRTMEVVGANLNR